MSSIFLLNIGHESEILNDTPSYTQPARVSIIRKSLELLPIWFAERNDFVLVDNISSIDYADKLRNMGLEIPTVIFPSQLKEINNATYKPWGISKTAIKKLQNLSDIYNIGNSMQYPKWHDDLMHINSRLFSRDILLDLQKQNILSTHISIPDVFYNINEIENLIAKKDTEILIKSPYSSSGIGLLWLRNGIGKSERQILEGMLSRQKLVTAEKIYEKELDLALEYHRPSMEDNFSLAGISLFRTNNKGVYEGNILKSQAKIKEDILHYISDEVFNHTESAINKIINNYCRLTSLSCFGIDMMLAKEGKEYILHPCVEVNPRYNMGYAAVKLFEKHICSESEGIYRVQYGTPRQLKEFADEQSQKNPLILEGNKIKHGFLPLTTLDEHTNYLAWIKIN